MTTKNRIETAAGGFVVERGGARGILANPKEARTQAFLAKGL